MTTAPLGRCRRWGAIVLLRLAGAILRNASALHQRRTIASAELRAALAAATFLNVPAPRSRCEQDGDPAGQVRMKDVGEID
ncbi:hypothetical protein AS156_03770 [Bradyrhizobium macuxiense]|uniref:Uncharacterized protein n=1 Tax=Bradyrhizobium macuxiense TaxID=1755647 RepID=A0A109JXC4_9BRAD|nr:hypothetical protein AS156_03770 [Bradyrhizobium macuxiense]